MGSRQRQPNQNRNDGDLLEQFDDGESPEFLTSHQHLLMVVPVREPGAAGSLPFELTIAMQTGS